MAGDVGRLVQADELRPLGFEAVQAFFGFGEGATAEEGDPSPDFGRDPQKNARGCDG